MLSEEVTTALLLANPADVYRLFNLTGSAETAVLSGMAGLTGGNAISPYLLLAILAAWVAAPLAAACTLFKGRPL